MSHLTWRAVSDDKQLDWEVAAKALTRTFTRRGTKIPSEVPEGLSDAFAEEPSKQIQWASFLRKNRLAVGERVSHGRYDIYLTGSNAFFLSSDLMTLFTGRHLEFRVYPFSFQEYRRYFSRVNDVDVAFDRYVVEGGLAGSYLYRDEASRVAYLKEIYLTILRRDIARRFNLSDTIVLERLAEFLMDNVGNVTSANNLAEILVRNKVKTNHVTVGRYLDCLADSFLFCKAKRYDVRGKRCLEKSGKFYLMDAAFRYAILGRRNMDFGHVYENIVYLELLRRGYDVYVGKLYKKEIDFVAMKGSEKVYIQVSDDISSPETRAREFDPLLKIHDAYPKMLITRTKHDATDYNGVRVVDIARWLDDRGW